MSRLEMLENQLQVYSRVSISCGGWVGIVALVGYFSYQRECICTILFAPLGTLRAKRAKKETEQISDKTHSLCKTSLSKRFAIQKHLFGHYLPVSSFARIFQVS